VSDHNAELQRAIAALRQARQKIEALERERPDPTIAVVGMACRFPGGDDLDDFWRLLRSGRDAVVEVPPDRWALADYYDADPHTTGRTASRHGGFVSDALGFDPQRFGIAEAEAEAMDPQQRMLLEVAAAAFERAGDAELEGSNTGVFVGLSTHDYAQRSLRDEAPEGIGPYTGTGNAFSTAVGRVAYVFGLHGPCLAVDTACSSTLVAAHLACESLRSGECDRALVAGVNLLLSPAMTVYFSRLGVLAPDGVCRSFDRHASGYVRAEGCGALVLRRRSDAERDGDPIVGLIRGSAVNSNGRGNGLTAPSRRAQIQVIRRSLARAGVGPDEVGYVEAFGSATPQGDAVELRALADVFTGRDSSGALPIASVKSNIGHAEAASGAASLIKTLLCLAHGELPPSLHYREPNPALATDDAPHVLRVLRSLEPWPANRPRIAGVSGFGFGGTNAHLVLEAAPRRPCATSRGPELIVLTARTVGALAQRRVELLALLDADPELPLVMLARGCAAVRHHAHRLAFVCSDLAEARAALRDGNGVWVGEAVAGQPPAELAEHLDRRAALDTLAAAFVRGHAPPWKRLLEPGPRISIPPHPPMRRAITNLPLVTRVQRATPSQLAELLAIPLARRRDRLEAWLCTRLAALVGRPVPPALPLTALGLDSMAVIDTIQTIQRELSLQVYPEELLDGGTVASLAELLARQLGHIHARTDEPADAPASRRISAIEHIAAATTTLPRDSIRLPTAVLVLSAPRCGSTLLRAMLAGHPALFAPPELHLLAHHDMAAWHRTLAPKMMHLGLVQALIGLGFDSRAASERVDDWVAKATPTAAVYAELQALAGPRRLVDKSPGHALERQALARAEALFEAPRYVILTRHPYAAIESFVRLRMGRLFGDERDLDPHLVAEAVWTQAYANLNALTSECPERCHRIAFEELVAAPEAATARLCEFLGIDFDPALLEPFAGDRMTDPHQGAIGFIGDPNFASRSRIEPGLGETWKDVRLPWKLGSATARLARRLGYATPVEGRDEVEAADAATDAILSPNFVVAPARAPTPDDEILLTGATGFLGVHLAAELLAQCDAPVRCLVRATDETEATERVRAAMIDAGTWRPEWHDRLRGEPSDLAAPRLGLDPDRWHALAEHTHTLVHNGAIVSFGLPYAALRNANVEGTRAVLQLAAEGRRKAVHFVSTKGVFTPEAYPDTAAIQEDDPVREPLGGLAYQRSKWAAERLVTAARAHGLETTVYRPGRIGGHSRTGRSNPDDLLCRLVRTCVAIGMVPDLTMRVEVTPVDQVAAAIVRVVHTPGATGHAYNLAHPDPISTATLRDALASVGFQLELVSWNRWREAVLADPQSPLAALAGLLRGDEPSRVDEARLATTNIRAVDPRWSPPHVVEQLLRDVEFMRTTGLFENDKP
jgi:thioester reductase-like protein